MIVVITIVVNWYTSEDTQIHAQFWICECFPWKHFHFLFDKQKAQTPKYFSLKTVPHVSSLFHRQDSHHALLPTPRGETKMHQEKCSLTRVSTVENGSTRHYARISKLKYLSDFCPKIEIFHCKFRKKQIFSWTFLGDGSIFCSSLETTSNLNCKA